MSPDPVLAHGLLDAAALPLPVPLLLWLSGTGVLAVAVLAGRRGEAAGPRRVYARLPTALTVAVDHAATRTVLRLAGAAGALLVVATAVLAPGSSAANPAPRLLYAVFWSGLVPASVLLGPVWRRLNPLRPLTALLARLAGDAEEEGTRPLPDWLGYRPAAAGVAVFVWSELVLPDEPTVVLVVVVVGALVQLGAASVYGQAWYDRGDPFEVVSDLAARLSPWGRDPDGRVALINPRVKLAAIPPVPGVLALVAVVVGATIFDGFAQTPAWHNRWLGLSDLARIAVDTGALALAILAVSGLIAVAVGRRGRRLLPALVPLVAGYSFVHHLAVFLIDGQVALAQASDPFDRGWDVLGTASRPVDLEVISAAAGGVLQLGVFLAVHLLAIVVANDLVARRLEPRAARAVQVGPRALLVASAVGGVALFLVGVGASGGA